MTCLGKPYEVLNSKEFLSVPIKYISETTAIGEQRSLIEAEESIVQTENALQTEAEERCTGKRRCYRIVRIIITIQNFSVNLRHGQVRDLEKIYRRCWCLSINFCSTLSIFDARYVTSIEEMKYLSFDL